MKKIFLLLLISISSVFGQTNLKWLQSQNYSSEYQTVLDYATTQFISYPTPDQRRYDDQFIKALVAGGIWAKADVIKKMATDGPVAFTDINLKSPGSNNSIRIKAPPFFKNDGFKFGGSTPQNYIDANWAPSTGVNYTLNNAELVFVYADITAGGFIDGVRDNSSALNGVLLNPMSSTSNSVWEVNGGQIVTNNAVFDGSTDMYFIGRTASNSGFIRKGSNSRITASPTSDGRTTRTFKFGTLDTGGALGSWTTRKIRFFYAGAALTTTEETALLNAWNTYYTQISSQPPVATLGTILNQKTWTTTSGYTANGTTPTITNNDLVFTGGSGVFTKTFDLDYYTTNENWGITTVGTISISGLGFGIGVRSTNTNGFYDVAAQFVGSGGAIGTGIMYTGSGGTYTQRGSSTTAQSFSLGDSIRLRFVRLYNQITIYTKNLTTNSTEYTQSFTYTTSPNMPNTSRFCLFNFGGTFAINSYLITSSEIYGAPYAIIGDSKTQQYQASLFNLRYASLLTDHFGLGPVLAGASDKTADVLNRVNEIIALHPRAAILAIGSNDARFSVSSATTISNYDAIVSALVGAGIRVIHTTGFYETSGIDQTPLRTHILATYNSADIIDTLGTTITLNGDGVHPDDAGMVTISNMILSSGKL